MLLLKIDNINILDKSEMVCYAAMAKLYIWEKIKCIKGNLKMDCLMGKGQSFYQMGRENQVIGLEETWSESIKDLVMIKLKNA